MVENTADDDWIEDFERFADIFNSDSVLEQLTGASPEMRRAVNSTPFGRLLRRVRVSAVMDANALLCVLRRLVTGKPSPIWDLVVAKNIVCCAPFQLEKDLRGKFEAIAADLRVPLSAVVEVWEGKMATYVQMESAEIPPAARERLEALKRRDPDDVEWCSLAFTIEADGIFTLDKDILEDGHQRVFWFGEAIKIVSTLNRGRLATTISIRAGSAALMLAGGIAAGTIALVKRLFALVVRLPFWFWIGVAAVAGLLMLFETTRKWILQVIEDVKSWLVDLYVKIKEMAIELWKVWASVFQMIMRSLDEANDVMKREPKIAKGSRRRRSMQPSSELEAQVVACVRSKRQPWTVRQIVDSILQHTRACDLRRFREQVRQILRNRHDILRVNRVRYRFATA